MNSDPYMCLADFKAYCNIHDEIDKVYSDKTKFAKMSLRNIANSSLFAADRSVTDYAEKIWNIKPVE